MSLLAHCNVESMIRPEEQGRLAAKKDGVRLKGVQNADTRAVRDPDAYSVAGTWQERGRLACSAADDRREKEYRYRDASPPPAHQSSTECPADEAWGLQWTGCRVRLSLHGLSSQLEYGTNSAHAVKGSSSVGCGDSGRCCLTVGRSAASGELCDSIDPWPTCRSAAAAA